MTAYFVTRHAGAIEWAARQGLAAERIEHMDPTVVRSGDLVMGTIPIHVAAEVCARGGRYLHLLMEIPPSARGKELSADDMTSYGARLVGYHITPTGIIDPRPEQIHPDRADE